MSYVIRLKTISYIISILLLCCLCVSCGTRKTDNDSKNPTFVVETVSAKAGDKDVAVNVLVKNNPGISSIALQVVYNETELSLTNYIFNENIGGQYAPFNAAAYPPKLVWINWSENVEGDWIFATLYFAVSDSADGKYNIKVTYNPEDIYNIDEQNIKFEIIDGGIILK